MSEQYRCENASKCGNEKVCCLAVPHDLEEGCLEGVNSSRTGCIKGSKCIPVIEGAYVPSDCELEACEMAREHIIMCEIHHISFDGCRACCDFFDKKCHLRKYLAAHGDAKAWEVE